MGTASQKLLSVPNSNPRPRQVPKKKALTDLVNLPRTQASCTQTTLSNNALIRGQDHEKTLNKQPG